MTKRITWTLLVLAALGLAVGLWKAPVAAQFASPFAQNIRIVGQHSQIANVDHTGALVTTAAGGTSAVTQSGTWNIAHITSVVHVAGQLEAVGQWNVAHVTSVTHIRGTAFIGDKSDPARNVAVTHSNALIVHIGSLGPNNGNPSFCHSTAAFVIHAGTNAAPIIHVGNRQKVAICGIVLTAGGAVDVSLVEGDDANGDQNNQGVWSGGCGARSGPSAGAWIPIIGGASRGLALSANSGFSSVAGIPWMQTQTRGNSVCLVKMQGTSHVTGTVTYAGF